MRSLEIDAAYAAFLEFEEITAGSPVSPPRCVKRIPAQQATAFALYLGAAGWSGVNVEFPPDSEIAEVSGYPPAEGGHD